MARNGFSSIGRRRKRVQAGPRWVLTNMKEQKDFSIIRALPLAARFDTRRATGLWFGSRIQKPQADSSTPRQKPLGGSKRTQQKTSRRQNQTLGTKTRRRRRQQVPMQWLTHLIRAQHGHPTPLCPRWLLMARSDFSIFGRRRQKVQDGPRWMLTNRKQQKSFSMIRAWSLAARGDTTVAACHRGSSLGRRRPRVERRVPR